MSINIQCRDLPRIVSTLGKVVPNRPTLNILAHVRVRNFNGGATMTVTNLDETLTATLPEASGDSFDALIPFAEFRDFVRSCDRSSQLTLSHSTELASIADATSGIVRRMDSPSIGDWPVPPPTPKSFVHVETAFWQAVRLASKSTESNPNRKAIGCVLVESANVVGTDGRHLVSYDVATEIDPSVAIPVSKLMGCDVFDGPCEFGVDASGDTPYVMLWNPNWSWTIKAVSGAEFPNWRQVVPSTSGMNSAIVIDEESVPKLLKAIGQMDRKDSEALKIEADHGGVFIASAVGFSSPIRIKGRCEGRPASIHIGRQMLERMLELGHRRIRVRDGLSPVLAEGGPCGGRMVFMPLRGNTPAQTTEAAEAAPATAATQEPKHEEAKPQQTTQSIDKPSHTTNANKEETMNMNTNETAKTASAIPMRSTLTQVPFKDTVNTETQDPVDELIELVGNAKESAYKHAEALTTLHRKVKDLKKGLTAKDRELASFKQIIGKFKNAVGF